MGEHGARALSGMLLENTTLVSLKLSGNHLDERAARHLAPALVSNQKLQHLDLSHNRFGDVAGVKRCEGFSAIGSIMSVHMRAADPFNNFDLL